MSNVPIESRKAQFRQSILDWFKKNARVYPWRSTNDPYHILIAEMLLRRTTATAVSRVYPNFIKMFDTPEKLASSKISDIESVVGTLGLQEMRAKHLHDMARIIVTNYSGVIPNDFSQLIELPGVGRYVASAVLNFAFVQPIPLVDGNIQHLISRVFDIAFKNSSDQRVWDFMASFGIEAQCTVFYWGIIDLVALVCLRKTPRCGICPLASFCNWRYSL
ncbi:MAG: hypothetical protein JW779_07005 [Candidatus Thorarchaeota archaeon]|nr:hypothetical protein [Candidatus Thorarchaeota archaeon]